MATLTLTLNADDIKKAVKSDTYITGQIDKSADMVKNAALAYNEQAGDDSYHEVKIYRTMKGAVGKFEAAMAEYVDPGSGNVPVADTLTATTTGNFTITIPVGSRFYAAFATTLSTLAQEYIINMMLYSWWQSIKTTLAKDYYQFAQESLEMVRKCLSKTPPATSLNSYSDVSGEIGDPSFWATIERLEHTKPEAGFYIYKNTCRNVNSPVVYLSDDMKLSIVTDKSDPELYQQNVYTVENGVLGKSRFEVEDEAVIQDNAIDALYNLYYRQAEYEMDGAKQVPNFNISEIKGYF